ncbi:MAG: (d)CMP kinase [Chloroflexota bacterium]
MIIAIDGPAASGKSTLGRRLAETFGYLYFDTGVMYRAVTLAALQRGIHMEDEAALQTLANEIEIDVLPPSKDDGRMYDVLLNGEDVTWDIRSSQVDANVSYPSMYTGVRKALSAQQRRIGLRGNTVMVGRDIGTVILPEAEVKIYLDASVDERARRRYLECQARKERVRYEDILKSMQKRDALDSGRDVAPLRPADDAVIFNSNHLNADQVFERAKELILKSSARTE